jgi:hypothetical protein
MANRPAAGTTANICPAIAAGKLGAAVAFTSPFHRMNPQGKRKQTAREKRDIEDAAICRYTEMCKSFDRQIEWEPTAERKYTAEEFRELEQTEESAFLADEEGAPGRFLPGDIHPTPAGDELLARRLKAALSRA